MKKCYTLPRSSLISVYVNIFFYQVSIQEYSAYSYAMVLFEIYFLTFCIFHYTEYPVTELCLEYVSILYNLIMYTC